ncbi:MAG TPA: DUF1844 domain-containing protein [Desulfatiglandales bacterium]|nr:DUF1844 domain-containing protein [Desulfatiglandales bacterium]
MAEEEKGFIIKDRRSFDKEGELKEEKGAGDAGTQKTEEEKSEQDTQRMPLPEVNFNSLIFSLSSSALLNMGDIAEPQTGERKKDLPMAKYSIDIISMLQEKTKGNLSEEEHRFLDSILADLRLRYVKAAKKQ